MSEEETLTDELACLQSTPRCPACYLHADCTFHFAPRSRTHTPLLPFCKHSLTEAGVQWIPSVIKAQNATCYPCAGLSKVFFILSNGDFARFTLECPCLKIALLLTHI